MIGYCGPSGISNMDYVVVDSYTTPPNQPESNCFHEKPLYQQPIFAPYKPTKKFPSTRRNSNSIGFRLGSTHKIPKLTPKTIEMWSAILHKIPGVQLCFYRDQFCDASIQNIIDLFKNNGIPSNRLEFDSSITGKNKSYLEVYQNIDVLLDTQPWSGHITACESLLMGVPVITVQGNNHAGRMVASILSVLGKPEWIADSPEQLPNCVEQVLKNWSSEKRQKLRKDFLRSDICNGALFTKYFEDNLRSFF